MKFFNALLALVFVGILLCAVSVGYALWIFKSAGPLQSPKVVMIKQGQSTFGIADTLKSDGVLSRETALLFPHIARLKGAASKLQAGEYEMPVGVSANRVIKILKSGETVQRQLTFAEGLTSFEIVSLLNECTDRERNPCVLTGKVTDIPPEGSLLPESYAYTRDESRSAVIKRMTAAMQKILDEAWENRMPDLPLKSKEEALILASIIEKETGISGERAKVSGVFINRLNIGMPLQTDPTVIYAITRGKKKLGRPLYFKDLKREDPYNTYVISGLPPGPIANPGRASILAALNPEKHDYIYFVADGTGGHAFAKTLAGHNENVAKWRKINKAK